MSVGAGRPLGRSGGRPVVAVVFRYVHHYRREFYERVRVLLDERGVDFRLVAIANG